MSDSARTAIERFNEAFNRHDVNAIMSWMTEDCVFENTRPAPDGTRIPGQAAVRAFWEEFFRRSPQAHFETEELIAAGDRCIVRWTTHGCATARRARARRGCLSRAGRKGCGEAVLCEGLKELRTRTKSGL